MATAMWAKTAVGTNLGFVKGFGRILKSWREILQSTLPRKHVPVKPKTQHLDIYGAEAKERCLYQFKPTHSFPKRSLQSRVFHSVFARTSSRTVASELRRQAALRFSSGPGRNFRNMPIMSLVGVTLGVNLTSVMDDGSARMMSQLQERFRGYTWQTEPLEKLPTCLDDLLINEKSIANGCEGAVYKAKVKADTMPEGKKEESGQAVDDSDYNLAVKAVFNYGAESNAHSILTELQREIVPLRPEGCRLDTPLGKRVSRLPPHPNIVDMPGVFVDDMLVTEEGLKNFPAAMPHRLDPEHYYGHNKTLYLVMRRRSSHLRDFLSKDTGGVPITMTKRCQILAQLLEGVAHLGQHGVAHRDLKADNILVDTPKGEDFPRVEICDFGCCLAEEDKSMKVSYPTRDMYLGGNSWLMAPEISTAVPGPDSILDYTKSDLWAVGAVAYEILGADNPFYPSRDNSRTQLNTRNYNEEGLPSLPEDVPQSVKLLVKALLARDPQKRPRASVAAAVAQIAALSLSSTTSPLSRGPLVCASTHQHGKPVTSKVCKGEGHLSQATKGRRHQPESSKVASSAAAGSFRNWSNQSRKWLNWVLAHGLALVCQLTFGNQSEPWNMQTVMSFLFLSRLTYADFREAMCYF